MNKEMITWHLYQTALSQRCSFPYRGNKHTNLRRVRPSFPLLPCRRVSVPYADIHRCSGRLLCIYKCLSESLLWAPPHVFSLSRHRFLAHLAFRLLCSSILRILPISLSSSRTRLHKIFLPLKYLLHLFRNVLLLAW